MALLCSGVLRLNSSAEGNNRCIQYEVEKDNLTPYLFSTAVSASSPYIGGLPKLFTDFYCHIQFETANVRWIFPPGSGTGYTLIDAEYKEPSGVWTSFFSDRSNSVSGYVGMRVTYSLTSSGDVEVRCGTTEGDLDLDNSIETGSGTVIATVENVNTGLNADIYFTANVTI